MIKDLDLNKNGWVVNGLVESLATGLSDLENILVFIKVMLERQAWKKRYVSAIHQIVEFDSFIEFLEAKPPEGLHVKYQTLWQVCHGRPDLQAMLDEVTEGKQGRPTRQEQEKMDNVHLLQTPSRNTRAAGLRKLRKYAQERPDVAEVYKKVLFGKISVNQALLDTGLEKTAEKTIPVDTSAHSVTYKD